MNDPNGMFVDEEGIWHLYYQCESQHSRGGRKEGYS
jgi:sucrose-6-phosphate hydrolase SacC (GH32 family)